MINYSIIIATYNWPDALELILANLALQLSANSDVEIVIADDGSTSSTKEIIVNFQIQFPDRIKHVWHEDNGFRKSVILNKAVLASAGKYLMFLDGDCIPFPDYISRHKILAEHGFFVAGNRVLLAKNYTLKILKNPVVVKDIFSWNIFDWLLAKLTKKVNKILAFVRTDSNARWRYARCHNWKYPKGCNIGVWKQDFIAVNGYDESFNGWGHEDADLFVRLLHNNVKIKDGRFAMPVLHLWHHDYSRDKESSNYQRLVDRVDNSQIIKATSGLDQYQTP